MAQGHNCAKNPNFYPFGHHVRVESFKKGVTFSVKTVILGTI